MPSFEISAHRPATFDPVLAAALDGDLLHATLSRVVEQVANAFPGTQPLIAGPGVPDGGEAFVVLANEGAKLRRACLEELSKSGPWPDGLRGMANGTVYTDNDFAPGLMTGPGPFWRLLRGTDPRTDRFSGIGFALDDGRRAALQVHYPAGRAAQLRAPLCDMLGRIAEQMAVVGRIRQMRGHLTDARCLSSNLLELFPFPLVLCDRSRRVSFANTRARALFEPGGALGLSLDGVLHFPGPGADEAMQRELDLLAKAARSRTAVMTLPGEGRNVVSIVRLGGRATVAGLPTDRDAPRFAVIYGDLAHPSEMDPNVLWRVFGMNPRETELAMALLEGRSISELAVRHSVSKETLRNQLATVMKKTATSRQQDLVALLSRLAVINTSV